MSSPSSLDLRVYTAARIFLTVAGIAASAASPDYS